MSAANQLMIFGSLVITEDNDSLLLDSWVAQGVSLGVFPSERLE